MTYTKDKMFCEAIYYVVKIEGGFVNDPKDPGGPTKFGVAWNKVGHHVTRMFGYKTWQDMRDKMTQDQAKQLYYEVFWLPSGAGGLTDEGLSYIHLDCAVNQGVGIAKGFLGGLSVNPFWYDGTGSKNALIFIRLYQEYIVKRLKRYTRLRQSLRREYMTGWVNRMIDVFYNVEKLEAAAVDD